MTWTVPKQVRDLRAQVRSWFSRYQNEFNSDTGTMQTDSGEGADRKTTLANLSARAASFASLGQKQDGGYIALCSQLAHMGSPVSGSQVDTGTASG